MRLLLTFALLAFSSIALAHDHWINQGGFRDPQSGEWCCGDGDCFAEEVKEFPGYVQVITGEHVPYSRVIPKSKDGRWWRCRKTIDNKDVTRCLLAPPKGV